jgi:ATP-dependent RNA helicase DDX19/DBP5
MYKAEIEAIKLKNVKQFKMNANEFVRKAFLDKFYSGFDIPSSQAMIFANTKKTVSFLSDVLRDHGKTAEILTSDIIDNDRDRIIDDFRRQKFSALISTNLLARGIDVPDVDIVINYNIPIIQEEGGWQEPDYANYLHRVGRTGRFETDGLALTFYHGESE